MREKHQMTDIFHSNLLFGCNYDGNLEIPYIEMDNVIPNKLISFSKALSTKDFNQWVHFYEHDEKFERIWNSPLKYLSKLKKFNGIITPDFSLYRDMPLVTQQYNTFRGRSLGSWWQKNGLRVLPNVRWSDERTYDLCCMGLQQFGTICIGTHGCLRKKIDKSFFINGLKIVVCKLKPKNIVIYGKTSNEIAEICNKNNVKIFQFKSEFEESRIGGNV